MCVQNPQTAIGLSRAVADEEHPVYCSQCGNPTQLEDKFCGSCGAMVLPPAPQAEQVVREPSLRAQSTPYASRRRNRFWVNAAAISLLLLVGIGAVAALATNDGLGLLGGSGPQSIADGGKDPAPVEGPDESEPDLASADSLPDPAFEDLVPLLQTRSTTPPIMLPADLPSVLENVAIDPNLEGDSYGVIFFREPPDNALQDWGRADAYGTLQASRAEEEVSNEFFESTSVETFEMPDGAEATLRRMEPVREQGGTQGPFWEGSFKEGNHAYTLTLLDDTSEEMAAQILTSMVEVPRTEQSDTSEEEKVEGFVYDYHEAVVRQDWDATYSMLDETSRQEFTEEEWAEKQQAVRDAEGSPAPLGSVDVRFQEGVSDAPATVILNYEDGTQETMVAGVPMAVTSEEEAGEPKRTLTEEEISYLEGLSEDEGDDLQSEVGEAAGDYYRAAGVGDWDYTYDALDSETRSGFTREEWSQKNQWFFDNGPAVYNIESVDIDESSPESLAEVVVRLTGNDGSSSTRITYFVYEDGEWKHRFSQEEKDLFGPGVPFGEWVEAQGEATPNGAEQYQDMSSPDELVPEDNGDRGEEM